MGIPYREHRCQNCKKLLFKGLLIEGEIEVKCKHCHEMSVLKESAMNEYMCAIQHCPNRIAIQPKE